MIVFNLSSYEYYLSEDQPEQMTVHSILLFLSNVQQGNMEVHGGRAWITRLRRMAYEITRQCFYHLQILVAFEKN